jgi:hypothetical protein
MPIPFNIQQSLDAFRRKYYKNQILGGCVVLLLLISSLFLTVIFGESLFNFSVTIRTILFFLLLAIFILVGVWKILIPLFKILRLGKTISDTESAIFIGKYIQEIDDKLLNLILLSKSSDRDNSLVEAAIQKKSSEIGLFSFSNAVSYYPNYRRARFLLIPAFIVTVFLFINPDVLTQGSYRLVNFNTDFPPPPPFIIVLDDVPQEVQEGGNVQIHAGIQGKEIPSELFIFVNRKGSEDWIPINMDLDGTNGFKGELSNILEDVQIRIGNNEVKTAPYPINVWKVPSVEKLKTIIRYPSYTGRKADTLPDNVGDFSALKGSFVTWIIQNRGEAEEVKMVMNTSNLPMIHNSGNSYSLNRVVMEGSEYYFQMNSKKGRSNTDTVKYQIMVEQDRFPTAVIRAPEVEYKIGINGLLPLDYELGDDYGLTKSELHYRFIKSNDGSKVSEQWKTLTLPFDKNLLNRLFHMDIDFGMMGIQTGDEVEYFVKVWDNDLVSGPKFSQSLSYKIVNPSLDQLYNDADKKTDEITKDLEAVSKEAEKINKEYNKFQQKLIEKKSLDYEDKKQLKNIMERQNQMNQSLDQIQNKLDKNRQMQKENNLLTPETLKKLEQLQKLVNEIKSPELNDFLKKMQEQMEKLRPEDLKKDMEQSKLDREQLQKDIERAMEMFKQFKAEQKAQELMKKLDNLKSRQDALNEQTEKKNSKDEEIKLKEKQDELNKEMEKLKEGVNELKDLKKETSTPQTEDMQKLGENQEGAKNDMNNASEQMSKGNQGKASESQKNASKKMKEMMDQLDSMAASAASEQDAENLEDLRDILENLIKISFDQEDLRDGLRKLRPNDPQMNQKAQDQRKIRDDMNMLRDSLYALASRVPDISKFVTDEVKQVQRSIERSIEFIGDRNLGMAGNDQQMAMTSMNNLANMLSDAMENMMQQMKKKGQPMSSGVCKKPGGKKPNMMQLGMQQKELNQKLQDMMKLGKMDPKQLSRMAAEQEMIRQQLKEAEEQMNEDGKPGMGNMDKVKEDMEKTEQDLMNNIITQETLLRQQKILSRMLDASKSVRERDMEEQRQSKSGSQQDRVSPAELNEDQKRELLRYELLKSLEAEFNPGMKILIERYFQEFGSKNGKTN